MKQMTEPMKVVTANLDQINLQEAMLDQETKINEEHDR